MQALFPQNRQCGVFVSTPPAMKSGYDLRRRTQFLITFCEKAAAGIAETEAARKFARCRYAAAAAAIMAQRIGRTRMAFLWDPARIFNKAPCRRARLHLFKALPADRADLPLIQCIEVAWVYAAVALRHEAEVVDPPDRARILPSRHTEDVVFHMTAVRQLHRAHDALEGSPLSPLSFRFRAKPSPLRPRSTWTVL